MSLPMVQQFSLVDIAIEAGSLEIAHQLLLALGDMERDTTLPESERNATSSESDRLAKWIKEQQR